MPNTARDTRRYPTSNSARGKDANNSRRNTGPVKVPMLNIDQMVFAFPMLDKFCVVARSLARY